ncbi:MAG: N-6 DNA methylase, partial [bacterium]|nr:N-6 DNA methylase [bacterium]
MPSSGQPEDQLRGPFEQLMQAAGPLLLEQQVVGCKGESHLEGADGKRGRRPDFAVHRGLQLAGYAELKPTGKGADVATFRGHDKSQWETFTILPNILYTDGEQWALYRLGQRIGEVVTLTKDIATGDKGVNPNAANRLHSLLSNFLNFNETVILPLDKHGRVIFKRFAEILASRCRLLREDVEHALKRGSRLSELAADWRNLLFPDADDAHFADAYAQTVTFALLLGRTETDHTGKGKDRPAKSVESTLPFTLESAVKALSAQHSLLSKALEVLTHEDIRAEIGSTYDLLFNLVAAVPPTLQSQAHDPWLYFYEDFLVAYDDKLRKDAGAYYTPVEVRLIHDLLVNRLGKRLGFADPSVFTLDPAVGTGTYLLGVIEQAIPHAVSVNGGGYKADAATTLAQNLFGFELMAGPYAVCELRVSTALMGHGGKIPDKGLGVLFTDTLESPNAQPERAGLFYREMSEHHKRALQFKKEQPVLVCLGNPPYDRHAAVDPAAEEENQLSPYGGWVRFGDPLLASKVSRNRKGRTFERTLKAGKDILAEREKHAILQDFITPAQAAGHGIHLKWLYNLYVYFWRWALWKVFEHDTTKGPGVVSFISASSYLFGDAFVGMREHMRKMCDEIWVIDLGGEGRGARQSENVFNIKTPVAIAIGYRRAAMNSSSPAQVHYFPLVDGTREEKLARLNELNCFDELDWTECSSEWRASFLPSGTGNYFDSPSIGDLFPWQHSGLMLKRIWPIGPEIALLEARWKALLLADDRSKAFRGSGDREVDGTYKVELTTGADTRSIASLPASTPMPRAIRYTYRSFDRQYLIADSRLNSRPRPELWATQSEDQIFFTSRLWKPIGIGPALVASTAIPDFDSFKGSDGDKGVVPLYRTADTSQPNIMPGLLDLLAAEYGRPLTPEDFAAYVYGLLAQPAFTAKFHAELATRQLRVPLTRDATLFEQVREHGARLLWLHTFGERPSSRERPVKVIPTGLAQVQQPIPGDPDKYPRKQSYDAESATLHVGAGSIGPVSPEVHGFEVSGLKVVQSWLKYRLK